MTQKIQLQFPRGIINPKVLEYWDQCPGDELGARILEAFQSPLPLRMTIKGPKAQVTRTKVSILSDAVSTFFVPATTTNFFAVKKFVVDTSEKAAVKIVSLSDCFKEEFLGKAETPFLGGEIYSRELKKTSVDSHIFAALGGKKVMEITLTELYAAMASQPNGKDGVLLNDSLLNVFYIRNVNNVLRAVMVSWLGVGWLIDSGPLYDPYGRRTGSLIFFRTLAF